MLNLFKKSTLKTIDKNSLDKEIESFKNKGTTGDDEGLIISTKFTILYILFLRKPLNLQKLSYGLEASSFLTEKKIFPQKC